jgi:outer membrane protein OmpA-like peptidoglycan-associated protein
MLRAGRLLHGGLPIMRSGSGAFCAVIWTLAAVAPANADCNTEAKALETAARGDDPAAIEFALGKIEGEGACTDRLRADARRVASRGMVRIAQHMTGQDRGQEQLLRRALDLGQTWQASAMLGDLMMARQDYAAATGDYQHALDLINDPVTTPSAPGQDTISHIFRLAAESRLLSPRYVPVPRDHRSGEAGGLALPDIRGFEVKAVPIPITFVTDSTDFTEPGRQAALDLLAYLSQQKPDVVTLTGHTDERGTEAYNQSLSERRVAAVAAFLGNNGYAGKVETKAYGEARPIELDDPSRYDREQIWQLNRRVELVRGTP